MMHPSDEQCLEIWRARGEYPGDVATLWAATALPHGCAFSPISRLRHGDSVNDAALIGFDGIPWCVAIGRSRESGDESRGAR